MSGSRRNLPSRSAPQSTTTRTELLVLGASLIVAAASGIIAYQTVGPYGDGPFSGGFRSIPNPETGGSTLVYDLVVQSTPVLAVVDEKTRRLSELRLDSDGDGVDDTRGYLDGAVVVRIEQDRDGDGDTGTDRR